MTNIEYEKLSDVDVISISEIHKNELEIGVLTLFGSQFLIEMYSSLLRSGNWGFIARLDGETIGFIVATQTEISLFKCLSIHSILHFVANSLFNPIKFFSFLIAFKEHYLHNSKYKIKPTKAIVELSHFAIIEEWKSKGIGGTLIKKFEEAAKARGFSSIYTRTHNERLSSHYIEKKRAKVLKRLPMASYNSRIFKWDI